MNPGILLSVHFFLGRDTLNDNKIIEHSACLYFTGVSVLLVEGEHFISFGQKPKSNTWFFSVISAYVFKFAFYNLEQKLTFFSCFV